MRRVILLFFFLAIGFLSHAQQACPVITIPLDNETNVSVDSDVGWSTVDGIIGYLISLGTTPGGSDILRGRSAAFDNRLTPIVGLPANRRIYVTISLFLEDGRFITCPGESFMTEIVTTPPECTTLASPANNEIDIGVARDITWNYAPTATGYLLSIIDEDGNVIFDDDVGNVLTYNPPENLPLNKTISVKITPYNDVGPAPTPCSTETFTTGEPTFDCSELSPEMGVPDQIGICAEGVSTIFSSTDIAEGFRWYRIENDSTETLISNTREVLVDAIGRYRYEAYNNLSLFGEVGECRTTKEFMVVLSEPPIITNIDVSTGSSGLQIAVHTSGNGNYEYALDNSNGSYQESNVFTNVSTDEHIAYVRDKSGCGIAERIAVRRLRREDFPNFFTPNGDGINDYWQFIRPLAFEGVSVKTLRIFDRYGSLLAQIDPQSKGWDGSFNGRPLPSSDYWFRAVSLNKQEIKGHFSLKR